MLHEMRIEDSASRQPDFKVLEARYRLPLRRFFERRLRNNPDPDDLVQEVFLRLSPVVARPVTGHAPKWMHREEG
jgi:DNA-directed RNA polymerase specialized sigma24 family protein